MRRTQRGIVRPTQLQLGACKCVVVEAAYRCELHAYFQTNHIGELGDRRIRRCRTVAGVIRHGVALHYESGPPRVHAAGRVDGSAAARHRTRLPQSRRNPVTTNCPSAAKCTSTRRSDQKPSQRVSSTAHFTSFVGVVSGSSTESISGRRGIARNEFGGAESLKDHGDRSRRGKQANAVVATPRSIDNGIRHSGRHEGHAGEIDVNIGSDQEKSVERVHQFHR